MAAGRIYFHAYMLFCFGYLLTRKCKFHADAAPSLGLRRGFPQRAGCVMGSSPGGERRTAVFLCIKTGYINPARCTSCCYFLPFRPAYWVAGASERKKPVQARSKIYNCYAAQHARTDSREHTPDGYLFLMHAKPPFRQSLSGGHTVDKPKTVAAIQPAQQGSDAQSYAVSGREHARMHLTALMRHRLPSRLAFPSTQKPPFRQSLNGGLQSGFITRAPWQPRRSRPCGRPRGWRSAGPARRRWG